MNKVVHFSKRFNDFLNLRLKKGIVTSLVHHLFTYFTASPQLFVFHTLKAAFFDTAASNLHMQLNAVVTHFRSSVADFFNDIKVNKAKKNFEMFSPNCEI